MMGGGGRARRRADVLPAFLVVEEIGALVCDMEAVNCRAIGRIENLGGIFGVDWVGCVAVEAFEMRLGLED